MRTRYLKRIARLAMMGLMVAIFAMPTSLVQICPCTTVCGESQCGCHALVTECGMAGELNCCSGSQASMPCDTVVKHGCGIDLLVCHCSDHCPCPCQCGQRNDQATIGCNRTVVRQTVERGIAGATVLPLTALVQSRLSRISNSPIVHVATAQQRCATLSRFLL